jgi:hypothetical protein
LNNYPVALLKLGEKNFKFQFVPPILPTAHNLPPHYFSPVNSNFTPNIPLFQNPYQPIQQPIFNYYNPSYQPLILSSMPTFIQNPNTIIIPDANHLTQLPQLCR